MHVSIPQSFDWKTRSPIRRPDEQEVALDHVVARDPTLPALERPDRKLTDPQFDRYAGGYAARTTSGASHVRHCDRPLDGWPRREGPARLVAHAGAIVQPAGAATPVLRGIDCRIRRSMSSNWSHSLESHSEMAAPVAPAVRWPGSIRIAF